MSWSQNNGRTRRKNTWQQEAIDNNHLGIYSREDCLRNLQWIIVSIVASIVERSHWAKTLILLRLDWGTPSPFLGNNCLAVGVLALDGYRFAIIQRKREVPLHDNASFDSILANEPGLPP